MPVSAMPSTCTTALPVEAVEPPVTSKDTSPPPNRLLMPVATVASASRYRSLPTPLALTVTWPLSAYRPMSSADSTRLPAARPTRALLFTRDCASGSLSIGNAVLFQRLTVAFASMRVRVPSAPCPPDSITEPSSARSSALVPTMAWLLPL